MTPEEKIIFYIRESLVEKLGVGFLSLSEKAQNDIVAFKIQELVKEYRKQ